MISLALEFERESLQMAFDSIKERKLRSALTVLGIVIGISAIIALVSIGQGTNAAVSQALGSLGANTLFVSSGGGVGGGGGGGGLGPPSTTTSLEKKDLDAIKGIKGIGVAVGMSVKSESVTVKSETKRLSFFGMDPKDAQKFFKELGVVQMQDGRFFTSGEKGVVVIGANVAAKSFTNPIKVNDKLTVGDKKIRVIGILKETGSSNYDSIAIAPIDDVSTDPNNPQYSIIFARVSNPDVIESTAAAVQKKMDDMDAMMDVEDRVKATTLINLKTGHGLVNYERC